MTSYDDIAVRATAYQAVREAGQRLQDVAAADAVLQARSALAECLVAAGWTPNSDVEADLAADRRLLLQPTGAWEQQLNVPGRRSTA